MTTIMKMVLAVVALIALAFVFPTINWVYDWADSNGTGILHQMGGSDTNDALLLSLVFVIPAIIIVAIIIFVARRQKAGQD